MKYVNLRLPDDEHARMMAAAEREFVPLTALLRKLFAQHEQSTAEIAAPVKPRKENAIDRANAAYAELCESMDWDDLYSRRDESSVLAWRTFNSQREELRRMSGGQALLPYPDHPIIRFFKDVAHQQSIDIGGQNGLKHWIAMAKQAAAARDAASNVIDIPDTFEGSRYASWTYQQLQAEFIQFLNSDDPTPRDLRYWMDKRESEMS
jgi:hypothetical protein